MTVTEQTRRATRLPSTLSKPPRQLKTSTFSQRLMLVIALITCLVIGQTRYCSLAKNSDTIYLPAARSQYLLFTRLLNNGRATAPFTKNKEGNPSDTYRSLAQIAVVLLLAGDVELNPEPQPASSTHLDATLLAMKQLATYASRGQINLATLPALPWLLLSTQLPQLTDVQQLVQLQQAQLTQPTQLPGQPCYTYLLRCSSG